jgi:hypothetical protein
VQLVYRYALAYLLRKVPSERERERENERERTRERERKRERSLLTIRER